MHGWNVLRKFLGNPLDEFEPTVICCRYVKATLVLSNKLSKLVRLLWAQTY